MRSYGVLSLLVLATASTASPLSHLRRQSSLVPTPPPACVALFNSNVTSNATATNLTDTSSISNITSNAATTNLTDTSSISNTTDTGNTTTTCLVSPSDLASLMASMNGTDLSNSTSAFNCSTVTNSTSLSTSTDTGNSNTTDTSNLTGDGSTSTDTSSSTTDSLALPTDTGSSAPPAITTTTDTSGSTTDSSTLPTDTGSSVPPANTSPPPPPPPAVAGSGSGSSGIPDASTGEFTANTNDPSGRRRKRSPIGSWLRTWRRRVHHRLSESKQRRFSQPDLPAVAQQWQDLCLASGGDIFTNEPCVNLAGIAGINALLSTGGVCDQQDNADNMIDFANSAGVTNKDALVAAAIAYRQHPRNADDIGGGIVPSTPYCTNPPRNQELVGIFNAQLPGVDPGLFGGPNEPIVAFGDAGTCPAGQTPDTSTCSCA
ncbi:hypothetical protein F5148DRAFT_1369451 [Russula earlei]|uniref:Uncharacterized protein n=1 Tax=Russula earlei TaxID=71964 RepID=A0ACC0U1Y2_9AGAM|nr:hypothetical protein F5148DRAFT_1369451 [Russula earlei]